MAGGWVVLIAEVEWRSERKGRQRPQAVLVGGERRAVQEERHWVAGPPVAGAPVETVWIVADAAGRRYRLRCREGGETRIDVAADQT